MVNKFMKSRYGTNLFLVDTIGQFLLNPENISMDWV